jgi:hypothetical protein
MEGKERVYIPVNIMHTERLDPILTKQLLLAAIDIPQTDINQFPQVHKMILLQPSENILLLLLRQPGQKRHRHTMDIATGAHLGNIDVGMRIDPDDTNLATQSLPRRPRNTRDTSDRDRVVAAERESELALARVLVCLSAECFRNGGHRARL